MTTYDTSMTMFDARQRYFSDNGFDGGYSERWVKLKAGPIPIYFYNAAGRRRAVQIHDLHHIATGYQTTWTGEAEIAAWEVAGGCGRFGWAWFLNLHAFVIGLVIAPRAAFRAFVRGRHSRNFYHQGELRPALLERSVAEARRALGLDQSTPPATAADGLWFSAWATAALLVQLAPLLLLVALVRALL
jgi:hypothetical protein